MRRRALGGNGDEVSQAPGELQLVQAFVNTADPRTRAGGFSSPRALAEWLASRGLLDSGETIEEADLARAIAFREDLRSLLTAHGAAGLDEAAVLRLDRAASEGRFRLRFGHGGVRLELVPGQTGRFGACLGRLLQIVFESQLGPHWTRLKVCEAKDCRTAFYDTQRNRTGKWCSRRCGIRHRVRTYRRGPKGAAERQIFRRR